MEVSKKVKQQKKKILLMGKSGAGKSSMRSIIFSNHNAKDARKLGATIEVENKRVKFLGNLLLDIWDCGGCVHPILALQLVLQISKPPITFLNLLTGPAFSQDRQDAFTELYLTEKKHIVFPGVGVLIYVFDVESSSFTRDLSTYASIISALSNWSPTARVFTLIHKMDLVAAEYRELVVNQKSAQIQDASGRFAGNMGFYGTSIWDESLYKAWGSIVNSLIPNLDTVERGLQDIADATEAEEVVLFEQATFLTVTRVGSALGDLNPYKDRYERLSNIIKTFRNSLL